MSDISIWNKMYEMNDLIETQEQRISALEAELKLAKSQAIQARAQAVTVTAERDQLRQELAQQREANITAFENGQAQGYTNAHRELQADARELAQAFQKARNGKAYIVPDCLEKYLEAQP